MVQFTKVELGNNWGHRYYFVGGEKLAFPNGYPNAPGDPVGDMLVKYPSGRTRREKIVFAHFYEEVDDHGKKYRAKSTIPMAEVNIEGIWVQIGLEAFDGVELPDSVVRKKK